jgi:hypothetical protein
MLTTLSSVSAAIQPCVNSGKQEERRLKPSLRAEAHATTRATLIGAEEAVVTASAQERGAADLFE